MMCGRFENATTVTACAFVTIFLIFRHDVINAINVAAGGGVPPPFPLNLLPHTITLISRFMYAVQCARSAFPTTLASCSVGLATAGAVAAGR